jgi:predicted metal-dependent hydrolase
MKDEILRYLEVEESSRAGRVRLRYRNGVFSLVRPEGVDVDLGEVVEGNLEWFGSYLEEARRFREGVPERCFEEGEVFQVLGDGKEVVVESRRSNVVRDDIFLAEHLVGRTGVRDQLEKALKGFAREVFEEKASDFVDEVDGDYGRISIRDQETRWGSCSSKGNLNFNWRLVLGPEHILEYVVVHELVHLEERDHGERFWSRVEEIYPGYRESRKWLSENSSKLVFDGFED